MPKLLTSNRRTSITLLPSLWESLCLSLSALVTKDVQELWKEEIAHNSGWKTATRDSKQPVTSLEKSTQTPTFRNQIAPHI